MVYEQLAHVYDRFMSDAPYKQWVSFTNTMIETLDKKPNHIVDLGCGTGKITCLLAEAGYQMTGVDFSTDMLVAAEQKSGSAQLPVQWIHQDLRALSGFENIEVAISYCDVLNYITSESDLHLVFTHVCDALKPGGLFIFDIHSLYYVENNMVNQTFTDVLDDVAYIWDCLPGDDAGEMYHDITFFAADQLGKYDRFDESHEQKTYPVSFYVKLLENCGFENIQLYSDFSCNKEEFNEKGDRIFFVTQKRLG